MFFFFFWFFFLQIVGSIGLNVTCEHVQCNKTTNAGVCGENRTCACDKVQEEGLSGMHSNKGRKMFI